MMQAGADERGHHTDALHLMYVFEQLYGRFALMFQIYIFSMLFKYLLETLNW